MKTTGRSGSGRFGSINGTHYNRLRHRLRSAKGATLPEYALLVSLLTLSSISSVQYLSEGSVNSFFSIGLAMEGFGTSAMVASPGSDGGPEGGPSTSTDSSAPDKGGHASYQTDGGGTTSDQEGDPNANYSDPQSGAGSNKPSKG